MAAATVGGVARVARVAVAMLVAEAARRGKTCAGRKGLLAAAGPARTAGGGRERLRACMRACVRACVRVC
eukprot:2880747-Pleurochrysis_carterae.AAC.1